MNAYANLFSEISEYERNINSNDTIYYFKKAIEFNSEKNLELTQIEIDELISKYADKSIEINKALLAANHFLLRNNENSEEVLLFLSEKFFKLNGLTELFFQAIQFTPDKQNQNK